MKFGKLAAVVALGVSMFSAQAALAGDQDFSLVNKTGVSIAKIMVSPHDQSSWGEDIMGRDTLACDETVDIKFHCNESAEFWDLKIIDKSGNEIVWGKLNLLKISKLTIRYEDSQATAEME